MFTLLKIENYPTNYTDKHTLVKDANLSIPLGCALTVKGDKAEIAASASLPNYVSTDASPVGSESVIAIPVNENMIFVTPLYNPDAKTVTEGDSVSVYTDDSGALAVTPDPNGKGKIVMICTPADKVCVQFKNK